MLGRVAAARLLAQQLARRGEAWPLLRALSGVADGASAQGGAGKEHEGPGEFKASEQRRLVSCSSPVKRIPRSRGSKFNQIIKQCPCRCAERDNRLRYMLVQHQPGNALDLLEKSLFHTPVIYPSAEGAKTRFLKLPPPQVCSKVLNSAAREPRLVVRCVAGAPGSKVLRSNSHNGIAKIQFVLL
jgi:hypothetical protein